MTELSNEMIQNVLRMIRTMNNATVHQAKQQIDTPQPTLFDKLQPGQVLQATLLSATADGKALLRLLGEKVTVETSVPLKQGQHIQVEVVKQNNIPQLKLLSLPSKQDIQTQFLKISMPKQTPLSSLMKALETLITNKTDNGLDKITQQLLRQLTQQIPNTQNLKQPEQFHQLMNDSGLFLESKLSKNLPVNTDTKTALLKIATRIRATLAQTSSGSTTLASKTEFAASQQNPVSQGQSAAQNKTASNASLIQRLVNNQHTTVSAKNTAADPKQAAMPKTTEQITTPGQPVLKANPQTNSPPPIRNTTAGQPQAQPQNPATQANTAQAGNNPDKTALASTHRPLIFRHSLASMNTASSAQAGAIKAETNLTFTQYMAKVGLFFLPQKKDTPQSQIGKIIENMVLARITMMNNLLSQVESGLARIQLQQLASAPQEDNTRQVWQFELPVKQGNEVVDFMVRIEQEDDEADSKNAGSVWTVSLNFEIGDLGRIHTRIQLNGENLSAGFWAEQEDTLKKILTHLPRLQKSLENLGLTVTHMNAVSGKPTDPVELPRPEEYLLDEKA